MAKYSANDLIKKINKLQNASNVHEINQIRQYFQAAKEKDLPFSKRKKYLKVAKDRATNLVDNNQIINGYKKQGGTFNQKTIDKIKMSQAIKQARAKGLLKPDMQIFKNVKPDKVVYNGKIKVSKKALMAASLILAGAAAYKAFRSGQKGKWITINGNKKIFIKG